MPQAPLPTASCQLPAYFSFCSTGSKQRATFMPVVCGAPSNVFFSVSLWTEWSFNIIIPRWGKAARHVSDSWLISTAAQRSFATNCGGKKCAASWAKATIAAAAAAGLPAGWATRTLDCRWWSPSYYEQLNQMQFLTRWQNKANAIFLCAPLNDWCILFKVVINSDCRGRQWRPRIPSPIVACGTRFLTLYGSCVFMDEWISLVCRNWKRPHSCLCHVQYGSGPGLARPARPNESNTKERSCPVAGYVLDPRCLMLPRSLCGPSGTERIDFFMNTKANKKHKQKWVR